MNAEECVRRHQACFYPLLPTMQGLTPDLISQALSEMSELYCDSHSTFSEQYVWLKLFLERTNTLTPSQKASIWERLLMFDRLWDESPMVQEMKKQSFEDGEVKGEAKGIAKGKAEGIAKGIAKGEVQTLQRILV